MTGFGWRERRESGSGETREGAPLGLRWSVRIEPICHPCPRAGPHVPWHAADFIEHLCAGLGMLSLGPHNPFCGSCCYSHFTGGKTGAQESSNLPKVALE